jgi:hypothetical protein
MENTTNPEPILVGYPKRRIYDHDLLTSQGWIFVPLNGRPKQAQAIRSSLYGKFGNLTVKKAYFGTAVGYVVRRK